MAADDMTLLGEYALHDSEDAFGALVSRHINLVYSVALRQMRDPHMAEEITQVVFIILARKAGSLSPKTILPGWLCRTARYASANALTIRRRRERREQEAYMESVSKEPETDAWTHIAPLLETALAQLGDKDHDAVVLRFLEGRSLSEVGTALGASEEAAKKRVNRALEKLRKFFTKRKVALSAAAIATAISANSVQAAPALLATSITAVGAAKGAAASGSTLAVVKGALKLMAWAKAKVAILGGSAIILAAGTTAVVIEKTVSPSMDESFWLNAGGLFTGNMSSDVPQIVLIRPTKFPTTNKMVISGEKIIGINSSMSMILFNFYGVDSSFRIEFPPNLPKGNFDLLANLPVGGRKAFQEELKRKFGITARHETRVRDALLLKVKETNAPGLKISKTYPPKVFPEPSGPGKIFFYQSRIRRLVYFVEQEFRQPIIDQTGLTNNYDLELTWDASNETGESERFKQAVLEQLGLELVPSREPIEMLIIERAKN